MIIFYIKKKVIKFIPNYWLKIIRHIRYRFLPKPLNSNLYINAVMGKSGVEIGGPSTLFSTVLPIYQKINTLDGVNFSNNTLWEGVVNKGQTYAYHKKIGHQFVTDGTYLPDIPNNKYEFVASSNCLEHIANPIKALMEWKRVIKKDGVLVLVVPNKNSNFDHKRPTTEFSHLLNDYELDVPESDLTHLDQIMALHDLKMDPMAGDINEFKRRSLANSVNRTLHHHVFDLENLELTVKYCGFEVVTKESTKRDLFLLAVKK